MSWLSHWRLVGIGVVGLAVVGSTTLALSAPAAAVGLVPPAEPPANIAPSSTDFLTSINSARVSEGLGPMALSETALAALPLPEQVLTVINLERTDRGLPPISYVSSQLNADAQLAANTASDPTFPSTLTGGAPLTFGGGVWAGGLNSVLEADYYWMYDDGYGGLLGQTSNVTCGLLSLSGCWGHRDVILHQFPGCGSSAPTLVMGAAYSPTGYPGGSIAAVLVSTCAPPPSDVLYVWTQTAAVAASSARTIGIASLPNGTGYWEAKSNGDVSNFGNAIDYGSMAGQALNSPIVGLAADPDGKGYWLVAADGGIFSFGDAGFHGSTGSLRLNKAIVGMAPTQDGEGYWLVASDGGIFSFGDAAFRGSTGSTLLNQPMVGMAPDDATGGYWLVAADGGIFSFGAPFFGSTGALHLDKPIVGMASLPNGLGYRFEASDGGVFCFGTALYQGSTGGTALAAPVIGMAASGTSLAGYWLAAADGGIFSFGNATYLGSVISAL